MGKTSVYFPQDLASKVAELDLNVSAICQEAVRRAIEARTQECSQCGRSRWEDAIAALPALAKDLRESATIMDWWAGEEYRQFANAIDRILAHWAKSRHVDPSE